MNRQLNILSIDWNYFIDVDMITRCMLFPDYPNEDYPKELEEAIWSMKYQDDALLQIDVNKNAVEKVQAMISNPYFSPTYMVVTDSHRYCYDFVKTIYDESQFDGINLMNVDFYHDMYLHGFTLDCSNWLYRLRNTLPDINHIWVHHPSSDLDVTLLGMLPKLCDNIKSIYEYDWDAVFICKSSMWSPPHLDDEFSDLFQKIASKRNAICEPGIFNSRFTATFCCQIAAQQHKYLTTF